MRMGTTLTRFIPHWPTATLRLNINEDSKALRITHGTPWSWLPTITVTFGR